MNADGSRPGYEVGQFRDPQAELSRLAEQASILAQAEEEALCALGLPERGALLDVGCGPGFVAMRIGKSRPALEITGVDRDPEVLARAGAHLKAVPGSAEKLPFADAAFDCVLARLVLRHLPDPAAAVREALRVLRPGGLLLAIDSDDGALLLHPLPVSFQEAMAARQATFQRRGADPFLGRRLAALFGAAGFTNLSLRALVVDSLTVGRSAFARIVLAPIADAIDGDLLPPAKVTAATESLQQWSADEAAFGLTTVLAVGGRKGG